jgi:hypothetical protein
MEKNKYIWEGETISIAGIASRVDVLERWQERQNGSIQRIEKKVDRLMWLHYTEMAAVCSCFCGIIIFLLRHMH